MKQTQLNTLFFVYLLLLMGYFFIRWPIVGVDSDTWVHLDYGRYLLHQGRIPHTSFFSYITPEKHFYNYSWLYQGLTYSLYHLFGFSGLIALRLTLFSIILLFIFRLLKKNQHPHWLPVVLTTALIALVYQCINIRPYVLTFLFIILFLYILECRPRLVFLLPPMALVWHKCHGVSYPVMVMIVLAYAAEYLWQRWRSRRHMARLDAGHQPGTLYQTLPTQYLFWLTLTLATLFASTHPIKFITLPFGSTQMLTRFISELARPTLSELLSLNLAHLTPKTAFTGYVVISSTLIAQNLLRRHLRVSHILILLGSIVLLLKGWRFTCEYTLLTLPCLTTANGSSSQQTAPSKFKLSHLPLYPVLIIVPLLYFTHNWGNRPQYPFSAKNVPLGIVSFLKHVDTGGRILNYHKTGGYLQWTLPPSYRIFINRQIFDFFNADDYFVANNAVYDKQSLNRFIHTYAPRYISLPRTWDNASLMTAFPDYALVFFDDHEVLYADRRTSASIVAQYRFDFVVPYYLDGLQLDALTPQERSRLKSDLIAYRRMFTHCRVVNRILCALYLQDNHFEAASRLARLILKDYPELDVGYKLRGDLARLQGNYREAVNMYQTALNKPSPYAQSSVAVELKRHLWYCYHQLGQYDHAYAALQSTINVFAPQTDYKQLGQLGLAALYSGRKYEALRMLRFAEYKTPPHAIAFKHQLETQIKRLGGQPLSAVPRPGSKTQIPGP